MDVIYGILGCAGLATIVALFLKFTGSDNVSDIREAISKVVQQYKQNDIQNIQSQEKVKKDDIDILNKQNKILQKEIINIKKELGHDTKEIEKLDSFDKLSDEEDELWN